ncbi:hypothetical protein [Luteolibacter sp. Populi]|uniref:hypothetical protein n=1 Tax=Luteolibacter sp. Populi TaxID=3230487 RepID=UPI0034670ABD
MKFNSISCSAAALLLLGTLSAARAQDTVSMKLDVVSWGEDITGLSLTAAGKASPITARAFTYSTPVRYNGPAVMEIHQEGGGAAADKAAGEKNAAAIPAELKALRAKDPTIVALAKLPVGSRRATVLIAPAQGGTYQTFVIDDDPSKLPFGKLRVHNYTPFKIAMKLNGKQGAPMKTRDSFVVEPKDGQVIYELAYEQNGAWTTQENNLIPVRPDEQVQLIILKSDAGFFLSGDGSRSGFLQSVSLRRPEKEPEPAEPAAAR